MRRRFTRPLNVRMLLGVSGLVLSLSASARANVIYTYTGNPFTTVQAPYTTADRVTATMTLPNPLAANLSNVDVTANLVSLSMSDGVQTLDLANPGPGTNPFIIAEFSTDSSGNITAWGVQITTSVMTDPTSTVGVGILTHSGPSIKVIDDGIEEAPPPTGSVSGVVRNAPGVWTLVPEPGTVTLLAIGLFAMACLTRSPM